MRRAQTAMFDEERLTLSHALQLTAESLRLYGERYQHWALAYSGGKDSTTALTVVAWLLETGAVPPPASLTILYADTRMELPPLVKAALQIMTELETRGLSWLSTKIVLPELDERFFVYMLGRGVPPPKNRFRWCTPQIKVEPMLRALSALREEAGEKLLMLTGVRLGESAARDQRIALSCSRDGAECGQGWFQETTPHGIADTLAPVVHFRACHVADWLAVDAPAQGYSTFDVLNVYGYGEEGSQEEIAGRTGCVGCNLASRDVALDRVIARPEWAYLAPLKRLKPLYAELIKPHNRLRKDGTEKRADGTLVKNPQRMGPLTMDARRWALGEIIRIQDEVSAKAPTFDDGITLINNQEERRIRELIAANTWPNRWSGEEITGDVLLPVRFVKGGWQHTLNALGPEVFS